MDFFLLSSVLLFFFRSVFAQDQDSKPLFESPVNSSSLWAPLKHEILRSKRSISHKITECLFATSEDTFYYYKAEESSDEVCGVYLFTEPDRIIEVHFEYLNVPCETGGLVTGIRFTKRGVIREKSWEQGEGRVVLVETEGLVSSAENQVGQKMLYMGRPMYSNGKRKKGSGNTGGMEGPMKWEDLITLDKAGKYLESKKQEKFFDGWELNGKFFPGINDHEKHFRQRYEEFCGMEKGKRTFITSQNAGMLHYRIPEKGKGFSFYVKFLKNPSPCNILVESKEDFYTLRNHGKANNCTLIAVFPAKVKVLALDVGDIPPAVETGIIYQCGRKEIVDRLQIGGSEDLDSSSFELFEDFCGLESSPGVDPLVVGCEVTIVRLLSSGLHDNSATFSIGQPEENELLQSAYNCKF